MFNFVFLSFLPNMMETKARYHQKLFCGRYSTNGDIFLSACQGLWKFIAFSFFYKNDTIVWFIPSLHKNYFKVVLMQWQPSLPSAEKLFTNNYI